MQEKTGELLSKEQYEALSSGEKESCHRLPDDVKDSTIKRLQFPMERSLRRSALKKLLKVSEKKKKQKRRAKNKVAKQSRKKNRK